MSADAWRVCPKCSASIVSKRELAIIEADSQYGKIPVNQWTKLHDDAHSMPVKETEETLREDYEIFTDESGKFYVGYHCSCKICGFAYKFKHEEQVVKT